jgi:hypothetical protein
MSKVIPEQKIESCLLCHYSKLNLTDQRTYCLHDKETRQVCNTYPNLIPSWCPLEDYKEPCPTCGDKDCSHKGTYTLDCPTCKPKEPQVENTAYCTIYNRMTCKKQIAQEIKEKLAALGFIPDGCQCDKVAVCQFHKWKQFWKEIEK